VIEKRMRCRFRGLKPGIERLPMGFVSLYSPCDAGMEAATE